MRTIALFCSLLAACGGEPPTAGPADAGVVIPQTLWMRHAHTDAVTVKDLRGNVRNGEEVCVEGRVKDFAANLAVFTLVDVRLKACSDRPDDACPTPWDYCCEPADEVAAATVTVEVHDAAGKPLAAPMKGVKGLNHLDTVTLTGRARVSPSGNVSIAATSIHRRIGS